MRFHRDLHLVFHKVFATKRFAPDFAFYIKWCTFCPFVHLGLEVAAMLGETTMEDDLEEVSVLQI